MAEIKKCLVFQGVIVIAIFFALVCLSYDTEKDREQEYRLATTKILSLSRMVQKLDSDKKQCASELKRYEDSNNELTLKLNRCENAKQEEEVRRSSQVVLLQKFYFSLKVIINIFLVLYKVIYLTYI